MTDPQELLALDQKLQVFALDGWRRIEADLQQRLDECTERVVFGESTSTEERERLRGKAKELKWLLDLPHQTEKDRDYLMDQLEQEAAQESE